MKHVLKSETRLLSPFPIELDHFFINLCVPLCSTKKFVILNKINNKKLTFLQDCFFARTSMVGCLGFQSMTNLRARAHTHTHASMQLSPETLDFEHET